MKTKSIITIGRQYGSGGHEIGTKVAEKLGIKFYDKEMLAVAAKKSGVCQDIIETYDEKPTSSLLYSIVMNTYSTGYSGSGNLYPEVPIDHKVFLAQFDAIQQIANKGPCVIIGRCADYALETYDNVITVFVQADFEARVSRIMRIYGLTEAKARERVARVDKSRSSYYNYYTNKKWGEVASYELSLSSSRLGLAGTVEAILRYVELKESIPKEDRIL